MSDNSLAPDGYRLVLEELKTSARGARLRTQRRVNTDLLELYWNIGNALSLAKHKAAGHRRA
ncbi:DUF1016 domain-containing protein [Cryobacterium lactosi]|uniref:DUF1016 domain-containing protein n=1 Tax=Cryobacterium lactosi TaxID=1259202 RepID=UPI00141BE9C1|nr:DUF1016 domain-containing protein [Cryobacterium lactosi]